jgi:hypothetical protein
MRRRVARSVSAKKSGTGPTLYHLVKGWTTTRYDDSDPSLSGVADRVGQVEFTARPAHWAGGTPCALGSEGGCHLLVLSRAPVVPFGGWVSAWDRARRFASGRLGRDAAGREPVGGRRERDGPDERLGGGRRHVFDQGACALATLGVSGVSSARSAGARRQSTEPWARRVGLPCPLRISSLSLATPDVEALVEG